MKIIKKYIIIFVTLFWVSGCAINTGLKIVDLERNPPSSPPRIIFGQTAFIYTNRHETFDAAYLEAWKSTGLFSDVRIASSNTPSLDGVYIRLTCRDYYGFDDYVLGLAPILNLVTLGVVPSKYDEHRVYCKTEFYQNGNMISGSSTDWKWGRWWSSWVTALLYPQDKVIGEGNIALAQNLVNRDLAALKRKYP